MERPCVPVATPGAERTASDGRSWYFVTRQFLPREVYRIANNGVIETAAKTPFLCGEEIASIYYLETDQGEGN